MPPARRPSRPGRPAARPEPSSGKKPPVALWAGIGGGVLLLVVIIILVIPSGSPPTAPPPSKPRTSTVPKPAPKAPSLTIAHYQVDTGATRVITVLIGGGAKKPGDFKLVDDKNNEYSASPAEAREHFRAESQKDPSALAVSFRAPADAGALDLRLPDGKTWPIYRPAGRTETTTLPGTAMADGRTLKATGEMKNGGFELALEPSGPSPRPLKPDQVYALTDSGDMLSPRVLTRDPVRLRYENLPANVKEIRVQIGHREPKPRYFLFKASKTGAAAPVAAAPKPAPPKPAAVDVRKQFEARRSDLVAALKYLATQPVDQARPIAREAVARAIGENLQAGMKAFTADDAAAAEKHLVRAALLASPYQPDFSRQVMRMVFLAGKPLRSKSTCTTCSGGGAHECKTCTKGRTEGQCPHCEAKGKVDCLVCEGSGSLDHYGYNGKIEIKITRPYKFKIMWQGKMRNATYHLQTVTYNMQPCRGRGSFHMSFNSVNTKTGKNTPGSEQKSCEDFWDLLKGNVFSGKAKIRIPSRTGGMVGFSSISARRFFADFESCKSGHVKCDGCNGRKRNTCTVCRGKGKSDLICPTCEGTTLKLCNACKGYGDAAWLAKMLPSALELTRELGDQAVALREWLDARSRIARNKEQISVQLTEAKKGLDPTAKVTPDLVEVKCLRCKGAGGSCQDCWATGRRQFHAGTTTYARYATANRLERRLKNVETAAADAPSLKSLPIRDAAAVAARRPAPPPPVPPRPKFREIAVPATVEEMIAKADELFEKGTGHLKNSKGSKDNATWINEGHLALEALRNAQTLYATAQETLDAKGLDVPRTLIKKFRTNMQALVMARKQLP